MKIEEVFEFLKKNKPVYVLMANKGSFYWRGLTIKKIDSYAIHFEGIIILGENVFSEGKNMKNEYILFPSVFKSEQEAIEYFICLIRKDLEIKS